MLDYYLFKQVYEHFLDGKTDEARCVLAELQEKYIQLCDEASVLRTQVQEYEDILYVAKNLEYDGFSYWLKTGTIKQGPFCQHCFDKDGLLIRLNEVGEAWKCSHCGMTREIGPDKVVLEKMVSQAQHKHESRKVIPLYK